jgi:predicted RNase H-like HicB family nuclease
MDWAAYIRKRGTNDFEAVAPDLPDCAVNCETKARALTDIHLLIETIISRLLGQNSEIPRPRTQTEIQQSTPVADAEWFSIHINLAHLQAVARHQAGRW